MIVGQGVDSSACAWSRLYPCFCASSKSTEGEAAALKRITTTVVVRLRGIWWGYLLFASSLVARFFQLLAKKNKKTKITTTTVVLRMHARTAGSGTRMILHRTCINYCLVDSNALLIDSIASSTVALRYQLHTAIGRIDSPPLLKWHGRIPMDSLDSSIADSSEAATHNPQAKPGPAG